MAVICVFVNNAVPYNVAHPYSMFYVALSVLERDSVCFNTKGNRREGIVSGKVCSSSKYVC